jgi:release factor glutamine methyltransferase
VKALDSIHDAVRELGAAGVPSPRVDAEHLVAHVLGSSRTALYADERALGEEELDRLQALVARRRKREPLAYILGEWGFRRLTLMVDSRVLIPRPETEMVVERSLEHLRKLSKPKVLEVGTGSGAIALAIVDEHSGARVTAVDRSAGALAVAAANREQAGVDGRVEFVRGDLLAGLTGPYDLVVSNPPYVLPNEFDTLEPEIRVYEPREALVGMGVDEAIARDARHVLRPGGRLVLECGDRQAGRVAAALKALGYGDVVVTRDLAERERVVDGRWT